MTLFKGSGVAIVTPFNKEGVDYDALKRLINWQIENGTDAIIICGTTGEASTMSLEEKKEAIRFTVEVSSGRVPVIAGTGGNNTAAVIELSLYAESVGVDGLLLVTPYYNRTSQKGLIAHYTAVADAVKTPIILYNVPGRTGVNIEPKTVLSLSQHPNIVAVKEASGNISQVAQIASLIPDDFAIYSGNDDMIVPILSLGGAGVISVFANICPKETHDMVDLYLSGDVIGAKKLQLDYLDLINALFIENNPIPVKTAMNLLGMEVGGLRLPLVDLEETHKVILIEQLQRVGLKIKE
jgi:4-hydroxy-tetrahydrodipicolinate synthase